MSLVLNIQPAAAKIEEVQGPTPDGGSQRLRNLMFLDPAMEFRIGPFNDEQWEGFLESLVDPEGAAERQAARSKLIMPQLRSVPFPGENGTQP